MVRLKTSSSRTWICPKGAYRWRISLFHLPDVRRAPNLSWNTCCMRIRQAGIVWWGCGTGVLQYPFHKIWVPWKSEIGGSPQFRFTVWFTPQSERCSSEIDPESREHATFCNEEFVSHPTRAVNFSRQGRVFSWACFSWQTFCNACKPIEFRHD